MRDHLLILLLFMCINANSSSWKMGFLRNALSRVKTSLDKDRLVAIRKDFYSLRSKIAAKLALSPIQKAALAENLKKLIHIQKARLNDVGNTIVEVNEKAQIGELLYQGDIVLTDQQAKEILDAAKGKRERRQAYRNGKYPYTTWLFGVFYSFHANASARIKRVFKKGAMEWQKESCIDFIESPKAPGRIELISEDGCWSYVGNRHKVQPLSLGKGCENVGAAAHEIGHSLGMFHTHSRHDRDDFITLNTQNIKSKYLDQFEKATPELNDNYGITYDYGSIMHYGASGFANEGTYSMVPLDSDYTQTLGSPFISFYEKLMMNIHYNCLEKCGKNAKAAKCSMGGFPNPRDCRICVCPSGYGGKLCNKRPSGCGKTLKAKPSPEKLVDVLGDDSKEKREREDFMFCHYWIQAPREKKVEVKMMGFTGGIASDGCYYGGVEIKAHKDQRLTGYRFCAPENAGKTLVSHSNLMPVITYNRVNKTTTILQYRSSV
ncbi:unnamed protein product [Cylicocyclus nassatus]|uniref:Zinc metalloproteinase n=1 Tax=Cylicocyclus nassatus TaxID=53992 RepID=A0AA36HF41_CYLNA|nr:unnamed protein product [Cylicocyclus nassatus]